MPPTPDTTTHAPPHSHYTPPMPRAGEPFSLDDIERICDSRINLAAQAQTRATAEAMKKTYKKQMLTYAGIGVAGAAVGVGITMGVQRLRRGGGGARPMGPAPSVTVHK